MISEGSCESLNYIQMEKKVILFCSNIFEKINAALVSKCMHTHAHTHR